MSFYIYFLEIKVRNYMRNQDKENKVENFGHVRIRTNGDTGKWRFMRAGFGEKCGQMGCNRHTNESMEWPGFGI